MKRKDIAKSYLNFLENGNMEKLIQLFDINGIVESPLYGIKKAAHFYRELNTVTSNSELQLKGIFVQEDSNDLALYFTYIWTLKNNQQVEFDVVDIMEFTSKDKIMKLKIIYDTVLSRKLVEEFKE